MIELTVPGHARPSVRITARTKWTAQAQSYLAWQKTVATVAMQYKPVTWKAIKLTLTFYFAIKKHGDLTNCVKATEDGLQYGRLIPNDRYVKELHARLCYTDDLRDERVEIRLEEIP